MSAPTVQRGVGRAWVAVPVEHEPTEGDPSLAPPARGGDPATDFVRFCYRRRPVPWPLLYDEMCAVAARGAFRGWGFSELAEQGVSFCLVDLPRLAGIAQEIAADEAARLDGVRPAAGDAIAGPNAG